MLIFTSSSSDDDDLSISSGSTKSYYPDESLSDTNKPILSHIDGVFVTETSSHLRIGQSYLPAI